MNLTEALQESMPSTLNSESIFKYISGTAPDEEENLPQKQEIETNVENNKILFFNYHEFTETYYAELESPTVLKEHDEAHALIITHFPNVYVPRNSEQFKATRVVRIPRTYESSLEYPCFSEVLPGLETAAITNEQDVHQFIPMGIYDGQAYGITSVSPLNRYLTQEEFHDIVSEINKSLKEAYNIYNWRNVVHLILGVLTLGLWKWIAEKISINRTTNLEHFISNVNDSFTIRAIPISVQPPTRSAFLSLDFTVPKP